MAEIPSLGSLSNACVRVQHCGGARCGGPIDFWQEGAHPIDHLLHEVARAIRRDVALGLDLQEMLGQVVREPLGILWRTGESHETGLLRKDSLFLSCALRNDVEPVAKEEQR